jgi:hypothetical protein
MARCGEEIEEGGEKVMEPIEMFKKLRDISDEIIKALESEDEKAAESAMGRFVMLMVQLDCLK